MKKVPRLFHLLILIFSLSIPMAFSQSSEDSGRVTKIADHVDGEVLLKVKADKLSDVITALNLKGYQNVRHFSLLAGNFVVAVSPIIGVKSLTSSIEEVQDLEGVIYAEPNYLYQVISPTQMAAPTDPSFELLWGLENRGNNEPLSSGGRNEVPGITGADAEANRAWGITKGAYSVKIAVIDTGIDYTHEDLKENIWINEKEYKGKPGVDDDNNGYIDDIHGYNFAENKGDPKDGHSHGTHCAGTIGAKHNNNVGVAGMMDEVTLVALKFLTDSGQGTTEAAIKAIDYATKMNVDIMSNSWGGGGFSKALEDVIREAANKGIIFVAAAGNSTSNNDSTPHYPSNYDLPNVIAVAAHTAQDKLASFSNWGKKSVHIAAPGKNILSSVPGNKYAVYSGTSMATPHVAGALGLLYALEGRLPLSDVKSRLIETSNYISSYRGKVIKSGRLSAFNLLTNTRPPQRGPAEGAWIDFPIANVFETPHPYLANMNLERSFQISGAKYVRAVVEKYDLEAKWDFLNIIDGSRATMESISGAGENYVTEYVDGDKITLNFKSDSVMHKWGVRVQMLQYQQ